MALRAARSLARRPAAAAPLSTASPPEGNRRHARAALSTRSLPDYNTPVDTAKIKLSRPKPVKRKPARGDWQGLKDLRARLAAEGSLVDDTLNDMKHDKDFQLTAKKLREEGQRKLTLEEKQRRRRCLEELGAPEFTEHLLQQAGCDGTRFATEVLQLNIGLYCNQACNHCHVESSPRRHEAMSSEVADKCLDILANSPSVTTLDITGGAPELQPEFRRIVRRCRELRPDVDIIDRCNLTVLAEPGQEDLADFLADHAVHVVASLPCYSDKNVNMQRGRGVFARSIEGLRRLNEVGYGNELKLDLVYNPLGAFLPPPQEALQDKYTEELQQHFGVSFAAAPESTFRRRRTRLHQTRSGHAIDATPARWRGDAGSSPLDRARTAAPSPRNDLVKNRRVHWLISTQVQRALHDDKYADQTLRGLPVAAGGTGGLPGTTC